MVAPVLRGDFRINYTNKIHVPASSKASAGYSLLPVRHGATGCKRACICPHDLEFRSCILTRTLHGAPGLVQVCKPARLRSPAVWGIHAG